MPDHESLRIENLGFLRWNFDSLADNLRLDDPRQIARELAPLRAYQGAAIVDLTPSAFGSQPHRQAELVAISRKTGVHIVAGCGFYVHATHPAWAHRASAARLTAHFLTELHDGIADTGVRPGIIGEIGTGAPPSTREWRVLQAAGEAAVATGTAINVHLDPFGHHGSEVVDALVAIGVPAERIVLSHLDSYRALDGTYHRELASTGAILEFDNFGLEYYTTQQRTLTRNATDLERLEHLGGLIADGFVEQIVLGLDVYTKAQLRRYGGTGYDHLLRRIVPVLRAQFGVSARDIDTILVRTPRRLLDRPSPTAT